MRFIGPTIEALASCGQHQPNKARELDLLEEETPILLFSNTAVAEHLISRIHIVLASMLLIMSKFL